jgi:hypothetical protein
LAYRCSIRRWAGRAVLARPAGSMDSRCPGATGSWTAQLMEKVGDLVRGWFGFPGWTGDDVIGVVEFFSREVRQPDEELLQRTGELGKLLGHILKDAEAPSASWAGRSLPLLALTPEMLRNQRRPFRVLYGL